MSVLRATAIGLGRVGYHSRLVLTLWLVVLVTALPMAIVLERSIRGDIGSSRIHRQLETGMDLGWLEEFHHRQGAVGELLEPVRVSSAMWLENLELWLNGEWLSGHRSVAAVVGVFLLVWIVCQGGILGQLAGDRGAFELRSFLGSGGEYLLRFVRLALIAGAAYYGIYRLGRWLFPTLELWTRDWTAETRVLLANLGAGGLIAIAMVYVHLIAEFARISTVREDRRSMLLAMLRSAWRVARHPVQAAAPFAILGVLMLVWQLGYLLLAPGVGAFGTLATVTTFLVGQVYLIGRWTLRIARYATELELFDGWEATEREGAGRGRRDH